jgi:hypothetical protein
LTSRIEVNHCIYLTMPKDLTQPVTPTPDRWQKWEIFYKYWKVAMINDEEIGQGEASDLARDKLRDELHNILDANEESGYKTTLKMYPGVETASDHPCRKGLVMWLVQVAV